jgi:hypothetical protein
VLFLNVCKIQALSLLLYSHMCSSTFIPHLSHHCVSSDLCEETIFRIHAATVAMDSNVRESVKIQEIKNLADWI